MYALITDADESRSEVNSWLAARIVPVSTRGVQTSDKEHVSASFATLNYSKRY